MRKVQTLVLLLSVTATCDNSRRELFDKTGVKPSQVGILVVNCSLFVPTPSWCAHIMNTFKMSSNVLSFNLGGMGCSGGG